MNVFNSLNELEDFVVEEKKRGKYVSEVYEMVQETPHLLERLYLMVTIGIVYVKTNETGPTEIMKDLLEMLKAVKNPLKGLFIRYYTLKKLKDIFPDKQTKYGG
jgi:vacuolar protein sorting-associated protein 35